MRKTHSVVMAGVCALLCADVARAQRGTSDWMTTAYDAQRSNWVRSDAKISPESMLKPGFELVWKMKFNNTARQLNSITPPALLDFYISYRGFRTLGFFGGSSDRVIAIDTDLGRTEWEKGGTAGAASSGTLACPGGMTSAVARPATTAYPNVPTGRGPGRGTPAKSGVGEPHAGAVTIRPAGTAPVPPAPSPVKAPSAAAAAAAAANPFAPRVQWLMALTGDGKLHSHYASNGEEPTPPIQFLPANAHAQGLIAIDGVAYAATSNSCGGVDNGVWALDLATKSVTHWKAPANVAGNAGPAVGPDGTLYAAAGTELVALSPRKLEVVAKHKHDGGAFMSSPLVFEFKGKNLIAATTAHGRVHLIDADGMTRVTGSERYAGQDFAAGGLASWQDPKGTRWLLAPGSATDATAGFQTNGDLKNGAIAAWRVVEKAGAIALEPAWTSRDLVSPLPPIIVNGVVFALSSGEFRTTDAGITAAQRVQRSSNAILYALDARTGKELWNSGGAITSFVHSGGMAAGGTRVYVSGHDGTQYAFGFPIEH